MSITRTAPAQQYEHIGNVRHGVQTGPWRVELSAPVKDEADSKNIVQGSVVSLNADGQFILGCGATTGANCPVPFISMKNIFDPDVTTGKQGRNMAESTYSSVGGKIVALPLTNGYEYETTEFDATATYKPNDGLTAGTSTKKGLFVKATAAPGGAEPYLGFVTIPPKVDYFDNKRIAFLSNFIPSGITGFAVTGEGTTVTWSADENGLTATLS